MMMTVTAEIVVWSYDNLLHHNYYYQYHHHLHHFIIICTITVIIIIVRCVPLNCPHDKECSTFFKMFTESVLFSGMPTQDGWIERYDK